MSTVANVEKHELLAMLVNNEYAPLVVGGDLVMLTRPDKHHAKHDQAILCIVKIANRREPTWLNYWETSISIEQIPEDAMRYVDTVRNIDGKSTAKTEWLRDRQPFSVPEGRRSMLSMFPNSIAVCISIGMLISSSLRFLDPAMRPIASNMIVAALVLFVAYGPLSRIVGLIKLKLSSYGSALKAARRFE